MPAKRRLAAASAKGKEHATDDRAPRPSKLAKENNISAAEEAEIKEAFHIFAVRDENGDYADEKEGVIPVAEVRRALIALGLPPSDKAEMKEIISTLDPSQTGFATYPHFLAICALKLHSRNSEDQSEEVEEAYRLFTGGSDGPITMSHLKRVARELKEDVPEQVLRDMIAEANGGTGWARGVNMDEFDGVMRRAGVFS